MIDPMTGIALGDALAGLTGSMAGMTPSAAYAGSTGTFDNNLNDIEIGYHNVETNKPAISGNTSGTIKDSQGSTASDAFDDDAGSVDSTTGGSILGSDVSTFNYCVGADSNNDPVALAPVEVSVPKAYQAISQLLGVSMDISKIDPVLGNKMSTALTLAGVLYYKGEQAVQGVMAWMDQNGVIYFAKEAIQAISDFFAEEGIGGDDYDTCTDPNTGNSYYMATSCKASMTSQYYGVIPNIDFDWHWRVINANNCEVFAWGTPGDQYVWAIGTDPDISFSVSSVNDTTRIDSDSRLTNSGSVYSYVVDDVRYYACYCRILQPLYEGSGYTDHPTAIDANPPESSGITLAVYPELIRAYAAGFAPSGEYPEGTEESEATKYTPISAPSGPDVLTESDPIETTPVRLPPTDSTLDDTADPTGATDDPEEQTTTPPIPLPIPDTRPSNPDIPLGIPSVVDSTLVDALVEELAETLDPMPPQSDGIIPLPFMPGTPVDPSDPSAGSSWDSEVPSGGSGLIHVYNPSNAQLIAFGHWLWVTYADASIDKIWNNPFDGVIGAFELYADAPEGALENIRSGFLVSTAQAPIVQQRYIEINCGSIVVPEFYGNYLDYSPYSQAYLYLPFIGINEVSVDDIVGHAVNIRYRVDCYNGTCIAMVYVAKDGYQNLCYQFAGNCAVEIPLAGGSQAAIKAGMIQAQAYANAGIASAGNNAISQLASGAATGGWAGAALGAISGLTSVGSAAAQGQAQLEAARVANKSSVQHSGSFGSSVGAMGLKIPHIMIRNPIQKKVVNYNLEYGFPAHKRVIIGGCTGYLRVKEVHVMSAYATDQEKAAIEMALKEGVFVT